MIHKPRIKNKIFAGAVLTAAVFVISIFIFGQFPSFAYAQYFPSTSDNFYQGTASDSTITCPDGAYVAGLARYHTGSDRDPVRVFCSYQSLFNLPSDFPSTSGSSGFGSFTTSGVDLCPDGYYAAGVRHDFSSSSGDKDPTQIYCAPAPSGYASEFQSTTNATSSNTMSNGVLIVNGSMNNNNNLYTCQDGYYMSGIGRRYSGSGDQDRIQIYCSPAPSVGDLNELCYPDGTCNAGLQCNANNICELIPICALGTENCPCDNGTCSDGSICDTA